MTRKSKTETALQTKGRRNKAGKGAGGLQRDTCKFLSPHRQSASAGRWIFSAGRKTSRECHSTVRARRTAMGMASAPSAYTTAPFVRSPAAPRRARVDVTAAINIHRCRAAGSPCQPSCQRRSTRGRAGGGPSAEGRGVGRAYRQVKQTRALPAGAAGRRRGPHDQKIFMHPNNHGEKSRPWRANAAAAAAVAYLGRRRRAGPR